MKSHPLSPELRNEIYNNFTRQHANNRARIRELHRYATAGFGEVFNRVPTLLNVNRPEDPGYVSDPDTPHGIKFIERQLWLPRKMRAETPGTSPAAAPVVESLFLIGSSGSVGHNASSDLDYWVCYEPSSFDARGFELFTQKLSLISQWAEETHDTEANFYTVDLADLAQGRLTRLDDAETEGEVAPLLLLEELYRTFLQVAGRPPIWQGLPLSVELEGYRAASQALTSEPDSEYIDLGYPALPRPQEMQAAALWLARKSEADPFKGILKIVTLLDYVESDFTRPLLCNRVKAAVLTADDEDLPVDPYIMTIDQVMEFGRDNLTPEELELMRTAAALKVLGGEGRTVLDLPPDSAKRKILEAWTRRWGWDRRHIDHLVNYNQWSDRAQLQLGADLLSLLTRVYIRIARHLIQNYPGQVNPQDDELTPLAARLLTRTGGLSSTVEHLPSAFHQSNLARTLILQHDPKSCTWNIHAADGAKTSDDNLVFTHNRAVRIAAWLVNNRVYGPGSRLYIRRPPGDPVRLAPEDMEELLQLTCEAFPEFNLRHENLETIWSSGGHGKILVALNFELPPEETDLTTADFVLRTGWGEMRHFFVNVGKEVSLADKYFKIVQAILKESGDHPSPENLVFQVPDTPEMRKAAGNIKVGLTAAAKKTRAVRPSKTRIDI